MTPLRNTIGAGLLLFVLIASTAYSTVHHITLEYPTITPLNTIVYLGDTVQWTPSGAHTSTSTTSSPKQWNSGIISQPFSLVVLPTDPIGNYPYICTLHSFEMRDTLRVVAISDCCVAPIRGNTNGDAAEMVNVLDLNLLIAFMFSGGRPPVCLEEADINGNGMVNVLDVNAMVAFMFNAGPPPANCPL